MAKLTTTLRSAALSHDGVEETIACKGTAVESASFRVKKKAFLFLSDAHVRVKLDASIAKAKKLGCDVGKLGWVKVDLAGKPPPVGVLKTWIRESYALMAGA
jgi:hypothetical protein